MNNKTNLILTIILFLLISPAIAKNHPCTKTKNQYPITLPQKIGSLKIGEQTIYAGEKLYLHINGEAELFQRYSFKSMLVNSYQDKTTKFQVQITQMQTNKNAFGIFSSYTNKHGKFVKIGSNGFIDEHSIYFYKSTFFIQVIHLKGKNYRQSMENVSREISRIIPGKNLRPKELNFFPNESLVKYTLRYIPKQFLGHRFLPPAFEARYSINPGETVRVFILLHKNTDESSTFIKKLKAKQKDIILEPRGNFIIGAIEFKEKKQVEPLIKKIVNRIEQSSANETRTSLPSKLKQ